MIFLTYNDLPSGIYYSQVTDVCKFFENELKVKVRLIALISLRNFFINRKKIKSEFSSSVVFPMFPGVGNWRFSIFFLKVFFFFNNSHKIIARGPIAASLALKLKEKGAVNWICYDGRGATAAEIKEYDVTPDEKIKKEMFKLEKNAVLKSDFRISVSNALVNYWQEAFSYSSKNHVVIPCTLNSEFIKKIPFEKEISEQRKKLGFNESDIIIAYSGSAAGWQSLKMADAFLYEQMKSNSNIKLVFLIKKLPSDMRIIKEFRNKIVVKWLKEEDVFYFLCCCDYGLLLRENTVTNKVSSPVKFAEYLNAGLKVIISENVGDFSTFVKKNDCGYVISEKINPTRVSYSEKERNALIAHKMLSKKAYIEEYRKLTG